MNQSTPKQVERTVTVRAIVSGIVVFSDASSYIVTAQFPDIAVDQTWKLTNNAQGGLLKAEQVKGGTNA